MAISFPSADGDQDEVIATINTTPLVDVMLVLLIIFLITIPVVTHTIPVQLPNEINDPYKTRPDNINISVTRDGTIFWDRQPVPNADALADRLKKVALLTPQPEVHIRGDQNARYEFIGKVILAAQRAGIAKVGFITEPAAHQ
jgi:biopolymer transport protein ExbD